MIGTRLLDRYHVVSELGRGGMGVVYRAHDPVLNREVAVKLIPPSLLSPESEERFQREAQLVAQMNHPAIVSIFDIGRHEGSLFFLMPVVRGRNLRRYLAEEARSVGQVVEIGIRVAEALEYSHNLGVIHRDVKPENIMISDEDGTMRVYVMDFGLAKASSENRLTKTGTLVGTVAYFSPEQVIARNIDPRSDIYALGVVLYECLAGEPPFTGEVQSLLYRIVHDQPRSPRSLGVNIGVELEDIILCCLKKDPAQRYARASELAAALRRCQASLGDSQKAVVLSGLMTEARARPAMSALINREKEFAELQRRLNAASAGECQFVVIGGEPGIGKTRLVEELETLARARKVPVLKGRFVEETRGFAYQAFCGVIQDHFRARDSGSGSGAVVDISDLAGELTEVFPVLNEISAIKSAASSPGQAGTVRRHDDKTAIYELLARTLTRMAAGKPLLLVFENLHAAESSLDALQHVVQRLEAVPILIVGTYRQTEIQKGHPLARLIDSLRGEPRFGSFILGPLTASQHQEFIASVLGAQELSKDLLECIFGATEGNPFFARELVRALMESGGIVRDDSGMWTLSGAVAISSDALPATIQQTVEKRLERLPQNVREVLSIAAVLGKTFDFEDLEGLVDEAGLDKIVDGLVAEGLVEEDRESRGDRLTFTSGIVRDVLYGSLSRRRRRVLHRQCAEHLERRYAKRIEGIYPQLVHHFAEGDEPEKTVEYGLRQARHALDSFSPEEAHEVLKVVIEFAGDPDWSGDATAEAEARLLLARVHKLQGSLDAALREADAAQRLFDRAGAGDRAIDVVAFAADVSWQARRIDDARRWLETGIERARTAGRHDALSNFLSLGATAASLRSDYETATIYLDEIERLNAGASVAARVDEIPSGGTIRCPIASFSLIDEPATVNTEEGAEITSLVFEALITTDENGRLLRGLANSWELLEEGASLRIGLHPEARFSDGSKVTAADVKASLERAARARPDKIPASLETVKGIHACRSGQADEIAGIRVLSEAELVIDLEQPLAIYPAMFTDPNVAIAKVGATPLGSGPFRLVEWTRGRARLERNPNYWKTPSRIDAIEFVVMDDAHATATAFRAGAIDVARDLPQRDLDEILRDPRLRPAYVEAPRRNTYFILFNERGPLAREVSLRKALAGTLRVQDLVWRALGRFAQPAPSLIPPGIVGHDAGRRREVVSREEAAAVAAALRERLGVETLRLTASVHPMYLDRYGPVLQAITASWQDIGVHIDIRTRTTDEYLATFQDNDEIDLLLGRWNSDYDDADNFTYGLFHSDNGVFRHYVSSPQLDDLMEQARRENGIVLRETLYRSFESAVLSTAAVVPLFYEVNYRVARRAVLGIALRPSRPYLNYAGLGIASTVEEGAAPRAVGLRSIDIHVPVIEETRSLDPAESVTYLDQEVGSNVFEGVVRCREGARMVPWLASSITSEEAGRRYRIRLRDDVRFHDGRRLTARDVRYSWERRLQTSGVIQALECIRGAPEVIRGEASGLEGFRIVSSHEFTLDLVEPLVFLPALLSEAGGAVVPEGTTTLGTTWREGCVGTGPFRVVEFQPGVSLELERNPDYWRPGLPKCDRLVFHLGQTPEKIRENFLAGRFSIASDIPPADVDAFLHDRELAARHKSLARLCIYFTALNRHSPKLSSVEARRALIHGLGTEALVRRTLGRLATPAAGVIPPGLLGHTGTRSASYEIPGDPAAIHGIELRAAVAPPFFGQYAAFTTELISIWRSRGVTLQVINKTSHEYLDAVRNGSPDVIIGRWMDAVSDADYFTNDLFHTGNSFLGQIVGTAAIDALIERGRSEQDSSVRHSIYRQIEEAVAKDAVLLPLFHEQTYRFVRPEVDGLSVNLSHPEVFYELLTVRR